MPTSDPAPGDHDELIAALLRKAKFFERPEGGANETFLLLNQAATALRTEQSARQKLQQRIDAARRELDAFRTIRIEVSSHEPNQARLALADRYVERAKFEIDTRNRDALLDDADRIYREELR